MVTRTDQLIPVRVPFDSVSRDATFSTRRFEYNPALDSVRGVAVLLVMIFHLGIFLNGFTPLAAGGFLGVDIFFVLSGFLITSVLIREQSRNGRISLRSFYLRRIYRLVPAYWLFLFVLLLFGWLVLPAAQTAELYRDNKFLFAATYLTNWNSAYGVTGGNLNHTWSLAIEEQFYLLWPAALVFALWRKCSPRHIVFVTVAVIVFLSVIRVVRVGSGTPLPVLYYSTESRIDALLIGCVASLVFMFRLVSDDLLRSKGYSVLAIAATVTMVWIISWLDEKNPDAFRIYISIFAICTAAVLLWLVAHPPGAFNWFFGNENLRWIGKISYGLYLWHYFCFEISRQIFTSLVLQMTFGVALAFATAAISFNFLERRFLLEKKRLEVT